MAGGGGESKTEKATPKKRRDERKEGNVFFSKDVVSVVFIFGAFYSLKLLFPGIAESASSFMVGIIALTESAGEVTAGTLQKVAYEFTMTAMSCLVPIMLICMALGILATGVQTKFLFSRKSVRPKFSRLSPIQGIKKMFSLRNAVELIKSMLKVVIMAVILYTVLKADFVTIVRTMDMDVTHSLVYVLSLMMEMVLKICLVFVVISVFDYLYQWWEYERNIKMSKHDLKEEFKQTEGNPEIKGRIKELQRQRAQSRMMQAVPDADVIIKNPTHFAVALRYDIDKDHAPVLLAKGQDEVALRIIGVGEENGVAVVENKPLARAIFAATELNQEIPSEYYGAVAEVLVYVYKLNKKVEQAMKRILDNAVALFVVVIVLLLIIPLSPFMLDVMIIINISISMIILLVSMNIKEALEFSIFPSMLLVTTLYRLGINVSSTKNILSNSGQAGQVIKSFGDFVLQGNVIVGFIVFLIIMLVQFLVITKGAERVSEVAARFTLDAMPGKQMAIDADLSSGLINEQEAKIRRSKIQREADFYGAMDGATKIVKGDAIMSLIITAINLIGGSAIGMVQGDMAFTDVLSVYSIATVGDGLVSQIPALLISTATGMIVTRSVSEGSLNEDVARQFTAQPKAIMMTGGVLAVLLLIPGMPKFQLAVLALALLLGGFFLMRKMRSEADALAASIVPETAGEEEAPQTEEEYYKDINNVYSLIGVEPIEMEFGYSLIPLVDESSGGKMLNRIVIFRRQYAQEMGFVIPSVRLRDSSSLNTNQYVIKVKGEEVTRGEILVDHYLALEPASPTAEVDGIETIEPAYGIPSKWILPENKELAEIYGYTVIDPLSVMLTHLSETIRQHAHELLNRQEVVQLVESLKKTAPELVEEAVPNVVSYGNLQKIMTTLLKEGIPIKDMETILETVCDCASGGSDITMVIEQVRMALKRTITRKFCTGGQMRVLTLDAELEKLMVESMAKSDQGIYLALSPDVMQHVIEQIGEELKKFSELSQDPVILTSQVIRVHVYRMLEAFYPGIYVLSFNEISSNIQIQAVGNITPS